jgi:hypothetical protein
MNACAALQSYWTELRRSHGGRIPSRFEVDPTKLAGMKILDAVFVLEWAPMRFRIAGSSVVASKAEILPIIERWEMALAMGLPVSLGVDSKAFSGNLVAFPLIGPSFRIDRAIGAVDRATVPIPLSRAGFPPLRVIQGGRQ